MDETLISIVAALAEPREPSISTLILLSGATFGATACDITSARQDWRAVRARHVAMYLARHLTGLSLREIGGRFGDRHYASVIYAVRSIERQLGTDAALAADVAAIRRAVAA